MKIATKTGDKGLSRLFNGRTLEKSDLIFESLGNIDELNSFLGWTKSEIVILQRTNGEDYSSITDFISKIQDDLYTIMSFIGFEGKYLGKLNAISDKELAYLDGVFEDYFKKIPNINEFVKPGSGRISSMFHTARTICRRAERSFLRCIFEGSFRDGEVEIEEKIKTENVLREEKNVEESYQKGTGHEKVYLNRLSDLLFVFAMFFENKE